MNPISFEKFENLQNDNHLKLSVNFHELFFHFQSVQRNSYFGKFITFLGL